MQENEHTVHHYACLEVKCGALPNVRSDTPSAGTTLQPCDLFIGMPERRLCAMSPSHNARTCLSELFVYGEGGIPVHTVTQLSDACSSKCP